MLTFWTQKGWGRDPHLKNRHLRRLAAGFANRQQVKLSVLALVEEDLVADLVDDNVPRVLGPAGAHQGRQDGVGHKYISLES